MAASAGIWIAALGIPAIGIAGGESGSESGSQLILQHPIALWGLLLPLLLLLLARLFARPHRLATGTLALWMRLDGADGSSANAARPGVPLPLWLLASSLALASLAASGPIFESPARARQWQVVVDRSPGMFLELLPRRKRAELEFLPADAFIDRSLCPRAEPERALRLEVALDAALAFLAEKWRAGDRVRWSSPGREALVRPDASAPPAVWLEPDAWPTPRPNFLAHDARGTVWVTDLALEPESASLFASGGAAVPGLLGRSLQEQLFWRGADLCESLPADPRRVLCANASTGPVAAIFETWSRARGFELTREESTTSATALTLHRPRPGASTGAVQIGRDGWTLRVKPEPHSSGQPNDESSPSVWIEHAGATLADWSPGQIHLHWTAVEAAQPAGDPAAFALSWARLFDRAVLPERGAVTLANRQAVGKPVSLASDPPPDSKPHSPPYRLDRTLALLASVLALAGAWSARAHG